MSEPVDYSVSVNRTAAATDEAELLRANALLIAAAPELLEALRVLTDHAAEYYPHFECPRGQNDIAAARAAIAKATGAEVAR